MRLRPTAPQTLGIWIDGDEVCVALCRGKKAAPQIQLTKKYSLQEHGSDVKQLDTAISKDTGSLAETLISTALPSNELLVRPLTVPLKKAKDIEEVISFQAEPILPFPAEESLIDWQAVKRLEDKTELVVHCTRKQQLQALLDRYQELGIDPETVSAAPIAAARLTEFITDSESPQALLFLGGSQSFVAVAKEGTLLSSHGLDSSWKQLREAVEAQGLDLDSEALASALQDSSPQNSALVEHFELLCNKLKQALLSFSKFSAEKHFSSVVILGPEYSSPISLAIQKALDISPAPISLAALPSLSEQEVCSFALPIGLALGAHSSSKHPINFRQDDLSYATPWKRHKGAMIQLVSLSLLIAATVYFVGSAWLQDKEASLRQSYLDLLSSARKTPAQLEQEYDTGSNWTDESALQFVTELSPDEIMDRVTFLEREIKATPPLYPLMPNIASVSDLLAWLSTHPKVTQVNPESGEAEALIEIESVSYSMLRRPEPSKRRDKYQVRVELEFSASTARQAREFHDALVAGSPLVDPNGEIKWGSSKGHYKTSFYLRDRTVYTQVIGGGS